MYNCDLAIVSINIYSFSWQHRYHKDFNTSLISYSFSRMQPRAGAGTAWTTAIELELSIRTVRTLQQLKLSARICTRSAGEFSYSPLGVRRERLGGGGGGGGGGGVDLR